MVCDTHAAFIAVFHGPSLPSTGGYERNIHHFISHFITNKDHMHIQGTEPVNLYQYTI